MRTSSQLAHEINTWGNKNFTVFMPEIGIVEEVGEAARCIIKRAQKIRGYEDPVFFEMKFADALADAGVYLFDFAGRAGIPIQFEPEAPVGQEDHHDLIAYILENLRRMVLDAAHGTQPTQISQISTQRVWNGLYWWAQMENLHLPTIVNDTWESVQKRDWVKDSAKGGQQGDLE